MAKQMLRPYVPSWLVLVLMVVVSFCVVDAVGKTELGKVKKADNLDDPVQHKDRSYLGEAGDNEPEPHLLGLNRAGSHIIDRVLTIQKRVDNNVNFIQPMEDYMNGFGDVTGSFWLGLHRISSLTSQGYNKLTILMEDHMGNRRTAQYSHFEVQPEIARFRMTVSGFSGDLLEDDFGFSNGSTFHTYDFPDANGCATHMKAGWWYSTCAKALLNGYYYTPGPYTPTSRYYDGIFCSSFGGFDHSLKTVSMILSSH